LYQGIIDSIKQIKVYLVNLKKTKFYVNFNLLSHNGLYFLMKKNIFPTRYIVASILILLYYCDTNPAPLHIKTFLPLSHLRFFIIKPHTF